MLTNKHGIDSLSFEQFCKVPFSQKFPNILYDICYSLGGNIDKIVNDRSLDSFFKNWISMQYNGKTIVEDKEILDKRNEESWLYNEEKRKAYINDIVSFRGRVQTIDVSFLLNKRRAKPKLTYG